jgi:hypothetical protein
LQEKVCNREEWKKLLRTAKNHHILHMPMEWMNNGQQEESKSVVTFGTSVCITLFPWWWSHNQNLNGEIRSNDNQNIYLFSLALQPSASYGLLVHKVFVITHDDESQSVRLLWMSDQLVAETSTWQIIKMYECVFFSGPIDQIM